MEFQEKCFWDLLTFKDHSHLRGRRRNSSIDARQIPNFCKHFTVPDFFSVHKSSGTVKCLQKLRIYLRRLLWLIQYASSIKQRNFCNSSLTYNIWEIHLSFTGSKWNLYLKLTFFGLKIMVKSGLDFFKFFHLQNYFTYLKLNSFLRKTEEICPKLKIN